MKRQVPELSRVTRLAAPKAPRDALILRAPISPTRSPMVPLFAGPTGISTNCHRDVFHGRRAACKIFLWTRRCARTAGAGACVSRDIKAHCCRESRGPLRADYFLSHLSVRSVARSLARHIGRARAPPSPQIERLYYSLLIVGIHL